jgi:eukaryotic-like serine/threonine-protein kinase
MRDAPGVRISDYCVDSELPAGKLEMAYRASHRMLPRCARIAVLRPQLVGDREAEEELLREACVLELLHHSGVPRVFECGVTERRPWIATEFIGGASIEQITAEHPLAIGDALAVLRDAAAVLGHAHHRGVVHRALTPAAISCTPARGFPLCVTGWERAAVRGRAGALVIEPGARFYCAPELLTEGRADAAADVFALGAILFEASTLVLPEPVQRFPGMPEPFHQLLAAMLARDPEERPTAAGVQSEAARLVELFADGSAAIEEVEVELVDISNVPPPMPNLGWVPPEHMARKRGQPLGALRRRRDP